MFTKKSQSAHSVLPPEEAHLGAMGVMLRVLSKGRPLIFSGNDLRHVMRIVFAGTAALAIYSWVHTSYGVFYVVYPIMLTALIPVFNAHIARQMIFNSLINCVEMLVLIGVLIYHPILMTLAMLMLYMFRFYLMSRGPLFLFGSMGVVCLSVMPNFLSYPTTDFHDLLVSNIVASVIAVVLSAVACYFIPDVEPRHRPPVVEKTAARVMHETLLASTVATLLFVFFQVYTLNDSLGALMAGIFVLFPMHYRGAVLSSTWRIIGVCLGCLYGVFIQLVVYDYSDHMLLMMPLVSLGLMVAARIHVLERVGAGVGFSILTTLGIMFGQYLHPEQDMMFNDLYRLSSVACSLIGTLSVVFLVHKLLNLFPATRFIVE